MKIRNPKSRYKLDLSKYKNIIDVGGGHNPHPKATIVVDKFVDSNYHRCGDIKVLKNQKFVNADGENLPFDENSFDYSISCHVLEHVDKPELFINELMRVSKKGYIETPSLFGEILAPKESHKWFILEIDEKLVFYEKDIILRDKKLMDIGALFLSFLPKHSLGYKIMERTYPDILTVRYEWKEDIEILINPVENKYSKYFEETWDLEKIEHFFPKYSLFKEVINSAKAFFDITKSVIRSKIG